MKTLAFHQWFSIHNLSRLNTRLVKKELLRKMISFSTKETFFFKCQTLHISKINPFLDLKRNKRLLENKSWEPLDIMVCYMDQWLWEYIYMFVQLWNSFPEGLKATKQTIIYTNITEDLFLKKKIYIKV